MNHIGIIGTGLMGTALTHRFLEHGWQVTVWNRTKENAAPLIAAGARWSDAPLRDVDTCLISLYNSDIVAAVLDAMDADLRTGHLLIDTTTGEPESSEQMARRLAARGIRYLDAPISGSSEQTRRGEATVMVSGDAGAYQDATAIWPMLGKAVFYCGDSGSAARMKLITNLVLGLNRAVLAEGLAYASAIGVDRAAALEVMKGSMAYSKAMDVKGQKMLTGDFTPQARLSQHLKDVRLILQSAAAAGRHLRLSETHCTLLEQAEAAGLGDLDNSVILKVIEQQ